MNKLKGFRPDIEGLRAVAVCLVVAFHASPRRVQGGFIGVDVFFVLSGYLITGLLVREVEETGGLSLAGFYARRARRLLPASALVFLATLLLCAVFLSPLQQARLGDSPRYTALYVSNFWFLQKATDYFAPGALGNPFLHTWSLAVEEQFYLVWPTIVLLGLRGRQARRTLLWIMIAIVAVSLVMCLRLTTTLQPWAFFSPFTRAWEFAIGGLALLLAPAGRRFASGLPRALGALASWLGLAAVVGSAVLLQGQSNWPGWRALIPVIGTVAILHARVPDIGAARILEWPVSQFVGRLSYSWYLWHWPLLAVTGAMHPGGVAFSQVLFETLLCVFGSFALAWLTHVLLENPIRFSRYLAPRRALSLSIAVAVTVVSAVSAVAWQRSAFQSATALASGRTLEILNAREGAISPCPAVGFLGTAVIECPSGAPEATFTAVLFGDSHVGQWRSAFDSIANDRGWRLNLISKPACPTARLTTFNGALQREYTECDVWREGAVKRIIELRPGVVVISNRQLQNFSQGLIDTNAAWRDGSRATLETLDAAGVRTVLLRDTPSPGFSIPECLAGNTSWWARRHAPVDNPCALNRAEALNEAVFRAEREAAAGLKNVSILDLSDLFCDGEVCPAVKNGLAVYEDDSHIDSDFARSLAPAVADRLAALISDAPR